MALGEFLPTAKLEEDLTRFEPSEPHSVIMWDHTYCTGGEKVKYSYVGMRLFGMWYVSGVDMSTRTWTQMAEKFPALRTGDFLIVNEWEHACRAISE